MALAAGPVGALAAEADKGMRELPINTNANCRNEQFSLENSLKSRDIELRKALYLYQLDRNKTQWAHTGDVRSHKGL